MRSVRLDPEKYQEAQEMRQEMITSWRQLEKFDERDAMDNPKRCFHCSMWFDAEKAIDKESMLVCEDCYVGK